MLGQALARRLGRRYAGMTEPIPLGGLTRRMYALHAGQVEGGQGPRDCLYRCSTGTGTSRTRWRATILGRKPAPFAFQTHAQFTCLLCPREKTYQGTASSVAAPQREVHPGEGNSLLEKLGRPLQKTRRSKRYDVCYKCGDLHTNLSKHSSGCDSTPPETIPPYSDGLGGEPSARNPVTPSTSAAERSHQSEQSLPSRRLPWGIEDVGPILDALDGTTLARMSLSTAKAARQEHLNALCPQPGSCTTLVRIFCSQCSKGSLSRWSPQRGPRH